MKSTHVFMPVNRRLLRRFFTCTTLFFSLLLLLQGCKKDFSKSKLNEDAFSRDEKQDGNRVPKALDIQLVADGLVSPLGVITAEEDELKRLFVIDQIGQIRIIDKNGNLLPTPFLDISSKLVRLNPNSDERGFLGVAFHPRFKRNGKFYVYYSAPPRAGGPTPTTVWNNLARVAEYRVSANDPNIADPNSERAVLELDDPQANHNGGTIAFGPEDGYLYIAIGDGGGANDINVGHVTDWYLPNAGGNGQDIENNLFGNILRLDVDNGMPYGIPASNPFVGKTGRDEVYAYGLRNPYRFSFDSKGEHNLIVGDVGQLMYEEINLIRKGGNYGWNVKEGYSCFNAAASQSPFGSCPIADNFGNPLVDPVIVQNNFRNPAGGKSIAMIGGNVYRGSRIESLRGKYVFGSYSQSGTTMSAELFVAKPGGNSPWAYEELTLASRPNDLGLLLKGFGEDRKGELYLTTTKSFGPSGTTGQVYKLVQLGNNNDKEEEDDDD